jgi:hypothetical protein
MLCGLVSSGSDKDPVCDFMINLQVAEKMVIFLQADLLCSMEVASCIQNCMGTQLFDTQ